jgi:hypothetical protein
MFVLLASIFHLHIRSNFYKKLKNKIQKILLIVHDLFCHLLQLNILIIYIIKFEKNKLVEYFVSLVHILLMAFFNIYDYNLFTTLCLVDNNYLIFVNFDIVLNVYLNKYLLHYQHNL